MKGEKAIICSESPERGVMKLPLVERGEQFQDGARMCDRRYAAAHDAEWLVSRSCRSPCCVCGRRSHGSGGCFGGGTAPPFPGGRPRHAQSSSDADELAVQRRRDARGPLAVLAARSTR